MENLYEMFWGELDQMKLMIYFVFGMLLVVGVVFACLVVPYILKPSRWVDRQIKKFGVNPMTTVVDEAKYFRSIRNRFISIGGVALVFLVYASFLGIKAYKSYKDFRLRTGHPEEVEKLTREIGTEIDKAERIIESLPKNVEK